MALKGIAYTEHKRLLDKLKALGNEDAELLALTLGSRYLDYQEVLRKLEKVICAYEQVAMTARKRKSKISKTEFFQTK